ncbi:MAG: ester cyclase [Bacteroidota bacterium]
MSKKDILSAFIAEVWNKQRKDLVKKFVAESYRIHLDPGDPWEGQTLNHETFTQRLDYSFHSFPDIHFELTSAIEEAHHVAVTWVLTGTNLGKINAYPPTHKKIKVKGLTIYYFEGNLIAGHSQIFDRTTVSAQLGFV